jgi:CDP-diacylglycerol--glycerol-3-phosphate 3-phosphatidyltransferase
MAASPSPAPAPAEEAASTDSQRTFGPSALATPANALTFGRLLASPVLLVLVLAIGPSSWLLASLWLVAASSDAVDGFVARRMGATRSGAFLDPLADKFLVVGVLAGLAQMGVVGWLPVGLIAAREGAMSVFRVYAGRRGVSVPARPTAKLKTFVQDVVVGLALIPNVGDHVSVVRDLLWAAVALTVYSGLEYAYDGRRLMAAAAPRSAR